MNKVKLALQVKKVQKQIKNHIIEVETGDGAVVLEITGEQKIKKIYIDPDVVKQLTENNELETLEDWIAEAISQAIRQSQEYATEKMKPFMGALSDLMPK